MSPSIGLWSILARILPAALLCVTFGGCTAKHHRENADKEVYKILAYKREKVLGDKSPFTIEQKPSDPLKDLPRKQQPLVPEQTQEAETPGNDTPPPAIISLAKVVEIAIQNSREYQRAKEDVYLSALGLTRERHEFSPSFTALLSGKWQRVDKEEAWAGDTQFGVSQTLATGAKLSLKVTSDFLHYTTGQPRNEAASVLAAELVQPLWRGAGFKVARENLTQAERDVVYDIRSFARFHRTFAVCIAGSYYEVLRQGSVVRNEWANYQRLRQGRERSESMARAGRLEEFQVDQAKQDELRARDRWIRAQQRYKQLLDGLKLDLALPTDANVDVDESELQKLSAQGIVHPDLSAEQVVRQALALRLDLLNTRDALADAERKVKVAVNGLGPDVDLVLSSRVGTQDDTKPVRFRFDKGSYDAGLDVALPLDRKAERNTYRRTLIELDRAKRGLVEMADRVKQQVRQAWRSLQEARESYEIQRNSLALAERRVDSANLLLQAGRFNTRDLLESQDALLEAQNAVTRALVDHTMARLQLWRDIGTLGVTSEGELEEQKP